MENLPLLHSRVFEKAGYVQKKVFNKIPTPKKSHFLVAQSPPANHLWSFGFMGQLV